MMDYSADCAEDAEGNDDLPGVTTPLSLSLSSSLGLSQDLRRQLKLPNKRKYEEEMEEVQKQIRSREAELKSLGVRPAEAVAADLRGLRAEKDAAIAKRKKIDADLKLLNLELTKKMGQLSRTESNLHYKSEAKFDDAIRKMEWQLKMQNFKLSEERRVVAEVDKLKRSKKVLTQYFAQKKEVDETRDSQQLMRGERESYYRAVTNLKNREEQLKKHSAIANEKGAELRTEINTLYERKRKSLADYKKQETDYQKMKSEHKVMQRKESSRRREEDRIAKEKALRKEQLDYVAQKEPFVDEKNLCNTLMLYLQRYCMADLPSSRDKVLASPRDEQPASAIGQAPGVADSLDDGMFVRLKKSDDTEVDYTIASKRPSKRNRKGRKLSVTKPLAHTPQIISQFSSLNLNAPSNMAEISASLEQLQARKRYYNEHSADITRPFLGSLSGSFSSSGSLSSLDSPLRERSSTWGFVVEVPSPIFENQTPSDAGISSESGFHDMSRQASKTESSGSTGDQQTSDLVLEELIQQSMEGGESEHSRSSSDTITLEDAAADDTEVKVVVDQTGHHSDETEVKVPVDITVDNGDKGQAIVNDNTTRSISACNTSQGCVENQSSGSHDNDSNCSSVFEETDFKTEDLLRGHNHAETCSMQTYNTDFPHIGDNLTHPKIVITCDSDSCDVGLAQGCGPCDGMAGSACSIGNRCSVHRPGEHVETISDINDNTLPGIAELHLNSEENILNLTSEENIPVNKCENCAAAVSNRKCEIPKFENVEICVQEAQSCDSVNIHTCESECSLLCDTISICDTDSAVCSQSDSDLGTSDTEVDHASPPSIDNVAGPSNGTDISTAISRDLEPADVS